MVSRSLIVGVMSIVLGGCFWPQFHFDAAHSGTSTETGISRANVATLHRAWSYQTGYFVEGSPSVFGSEVYICSDTGDLYALDTTTGTLEWSVDVDCANYASPAVTNSTVYLGAAGGQMWALDRSTGAVRWKTVVDDNPLAGSSFIDSPTTYADGMVFAGNNNHYLYAFSATTGAVVWKAEAADTTCTGADCSGGSIYESPAVANGRVFASSVKGMLAAYDAHSGAVLWVTNLGSYTTSSPAVSGDVLFIGGAKLRAVDVATGSVLWQTGFGGDVVGTPAVSNGIVYAGSTDDNVYAVNATTGAVVWSRATAGRITTAGPSLANGLVFVGSEDNELYALNSDDGTVLWSATVGAYDTFHSTPAITNGKVFVGSYDGTISAYEP